MDGSRGKRWVTGLAGGYRRGRGRLIGKTSSIKVGTFDTLVAVLVDGARAETGSPNDATAANARAEVAETYLAT